MSNPTIVKLRDNEPWIKQLGNKVTTRSLVRFHGKRLISAYQLRELLKTITKEDKATHKILNAGVEIIVCGHGLTSKTFFRFIDLPVTYRGSQLHALVKTFSVRTREISGK